MSYELKRINFIGDDNDERNDEGWWYERKYFNMVTKNGDVVEIMFKEDYFGDFPKGEDFYRMENGDWKEIDINDEHYQFTTDVFYYLMEEYRDYMSDGYGESIGEEEIEEMMNSI